jgi:hypothetical protein
MRKLWWCLVVPLVMLLAGCGGTVQLRDVPAERSLVYAYLDFSEVKLNLNWAKLRQVLPVIEKPYYGMGYIPDPQNPYRVLVWHEDLGNGTYQVSGFGGVSVYITQKVKINIHMPDTGKNATAVRIERPGIYFLGAYKVTMPGSRWGAFINRNYVIEPVAPPPETDMLKQLLAIANGSGWQARIEQRLRGGSI